MNYGVSYKGSKNSIAKKIVDQLPPAEHFYDLFAGGCAITHCAMLSGKYKYIHVNDITNVPQLFVDAINGKYKNEKRWISREDFFKLKDTDPYINICWSFGNNCENYLYSKGIEEYKKAYWYLLVLDDFSLYQKYSVKLADSIYKNTRGIISTKQKRIIARHEIQKYFIDNHGAFWSGINQNSDKKHIYATYGEQLKFLQLESLERLERLQSLERLQALESLERLERLQALQSLERLERLQSLGRLQSLQLESLERLENVIVTQSDYRDVKIEKDSVIYCDIPYKNTDGYNNSDFDHEAFYSWALKQKNIFISEYAMPEERFNCIFLTKKQQKLCINATIKIKDEKIFIPKNQIITQPKIISAEKKYAQIMFDFMQEYA